MDIHTYVVVNKAGEYIGEEHDTVSEARAGAEQESEPCAVVELTYTFEDSELVWTPDGGDVWPPA